jgi:D-serine deaminase-like pyridoxal phosphate-dependent protein
MHVQDKTINRLLLLVDTEAEGVLIISHDHPCFVRNKFDIYVVIAITETIPLLVDY